MNKATGIKRIINATGYSIQGLKATFKHEAAFRQELLLALVLVPVAVLLPVLAWQKALMIASIFIVLIVELLNSAIEATVDRVGEEYHDLSARAKDIGSAAVFVALLMMGCMWGYALLTLI